MLLQRIQRGDNSLIGELKELAEHPDAPRDARYNAALFHHGAGEFDSAAGLLERNVKDDPRDHESLNVWGTVLSVQAKTKSGAEADDLFEQAGQKYEAALTIKPDDHEVLNNWGSALVKQAKTKTGKEAERLLAQAAEKLLAAEQLSEGSAAYILARLAALQGEREQCRHWLEKSQAAGTLPSRSQLEEDSDLESVREEEWFQRLVNSRAES
jgi:Tfp pilus assembly protein PilF